MTRTSGKAPAAAPPGLVVGGLGGPAEELLEAGQEEVFSRTEVESGRIEHQAGAGGARRRPPET
ncbi:hypothetical protein [uncultured Brevundimonas sp.]|uniref:hypothetical protein n=1 Tax=uncultured Brevundimonas sp. TaxID=213418 RepID=UPI002606ABDE|nr:hypothetical protein [uncultured Brevundimonas sp.]